MFLSVLYFILFLVQSGSLLKFEQMTPAKVELNFSLFSEKQQKRGVERKGPGKGKSTSGAPKKRQVGDEDHLEWPTPP